MRLIDADALIANTEVFCDMYEVNWTIGKVRAWIGNAPTIEAEPVKYGHWLWDGKHFYCSVCSGTRCHDLVLGMDAAYCPYCGAKLEDVEDGTK